jgi:hypothetical protein
MSLETDVDEMLSFKRDSFLFAPPSLPDRFEELPIETRSAVKAGLERVLMLARSVDHVDDIPPYTEIYSTLLGVLEHLEMKRLPQ